jgi:formiminoglutamase
LNPGRCDQAPAALRAVLQRMSVYDLENDRDLRALSVRDFGDLPVADLRPEAAFAHIREKLEAIADSAREAVVIFGGDNSVTRPAVHALWRQARPTALLTFDAHFDLRDLEGGLTNGNPIRALLADALPGSSIVQIGLQAFANSQEYARVARAAGIRVVGIHEARRHGLEATTRQALNDLGARAERIYVDTDLDVLDRSLAPGTSGSRPGGLSLPELCRALQICGADQKVRMIDFVEFDPTRDIAQITAFSGAIALLSFLSGVTARRAGT